MRSLQEIIQSNESQILADWLDLQHKSLGKSDVLKDADRREQSRSVLTAVAQAMRFGNLDDIHKDEWNPVLTTINSIAAARAASGSSTSETATFLFSLKQPIFNVL